MNAADQEGSSPSPGAFYVCTTLDCGLRFPVVAGVKWNGRCPRCRSAVIRVADVPLGTPANGERNDSLPEFHLLLDNWRSLFNVGSALRTADGAGVRHVYLCGITATPDHPKLAKTALGAEHAVRWSYHPDAVKQAELLKAQGAQLWVLEELSDAEPIEQVKRNGWGDAQLVVLAAGNEITGVDPGLLALADRAIVLPMRGMKRSLNVAVATGIALYMLTV